MALRGSSSRKTISRGTLKRARLAFTCSLRSSSDTSPVRTTKAQPLAKVVVVDADRGGLAHRSWRDQAVLDLLREDVLAAGDDHVVVAARDVQPAVRVEAADVAGGHQAVDVSLVPPPV